MKASIQGRRAKRSKRAYALRIWAVIKCTVFEFFQDGATLYGAALSFFALFALPPLLVLLMLLLGYFVDGTLIQEQILTQVRLAGGQTHAQVVKTILENVTEPGQTNAFAIMISLGVIAFSASNIFVQLQRTLNTIWGVKPNPNAGLKELVQARLLSFGMILSLSFLVVMLLILDVALSLIENTMGLQLGLLEELQLFKLINMGISFVVLTLTLIGIFKVLPDVTTRWRDVSIGALVTAFLLSISKYFIGYYLSTSNLGSAYGAAGSTILFSFWLYLNILIFLMGAEFAESYAREFGEPFKPKNIAQWREDAHPDEAPSDIEEGVQAPDEQPHEQGA